eukprot:9408052-Alexandrium_andersonii.AAC.1
MSSPPSTRACRTIGRKESGRARALPTSACCCAAHTDQVATVGVGVGGSVSEVPRRAGLRGTSKEGLVQDLRRSRAEARAC